LHLFSHRLSFLLIVPYNSYLWPIRPLLVMVLPELLVVAAAIGQTRTLASEV